MLKISNTYDVVKYIVELKQKGFTRIYDEGKKQHIQFQLDIKNSNQTRIYYNMLVSEDKNQWKYNLKYLEIYNIEKILKKMLEKSKPLVIPDV